MGAVEDEDAMPPVEMQATCRTEGCPVEGVSFVASLYANASPPVYRASCGQCGLPVTDLVPLS